jgi:hypothetical protein
VKEITVERNKSIKIYDDVLDLCQRQHLYSFVTKSLFTIGWADGAILENQQNKFLHSVYSNEDLNNFKLLNYLQGTELSKDLEGYKVDQAIVNLSMPSDYNYVHAHAQDKVLLYYVNLEWQDGWHGETLFFNESCKDVVFASSFTPGRFILFDANIPHTIRPQSIIAAKYRFTFALTLNKC